LLLSEILNCMPSTREMYRQFPLQIPDFAAYILLQ
jgi:hypothetical protein